LRWHVGPERFALAHSADNLPWKVYRHQSKLRRHLSGDPNETLWQNNKVVNHATALPRLNNILIRPGETFSFWRLVGRPTRNRGFREGMELHLGKARSGIGGGLCQIGNLIHWLALHSPLTVTQRASHSFDPFPDQGRVIPYGTGAALFYNYIDIWLHNPTAATFQLRLWLTETLLNGELRTDIWLPHRYRVFGSNDRFERTTDGWMRQNEIWRETYEKSEAATLLKLERLYTNRVRVMYSPEESEVLAANQIQP